MKRICLVVLLFAGLGVFQEDVHGASAPRDSVSRGKYIVDRVAMCIECHTPRNQKGDLIESQYLQGAPIPVNSPPYQNMKWALKAPAIGGLIGYTNEEGVRLLTEGITRDGRVPSPPMPPFRLTRPDAEAVVNYLKSFK